MTPDSDAKLAEDLALGGEVARYGSGRFEFQPRQPQAPVPQASQFYRTGQYITGAPHPPVSSSTSSSYDSSTLSHLQQQQAGGYPLSYGYDVVAGDARWLLHGQYPRTAAAAFAPAAARPGVDYPSAPPGYSDGGGGGGLVGNAAPTLTRRATVEYRAHPTATTTAGPPIGAGGVYSMDYPPLSFAALPFQATAGYGKQNY